MSSVLIETYILFKKSLKVLQLQYHLSFQPKMGSNTSLDYIHRFERISVGLVMHDQLFKYTHLAWSQALKTLIIVPIRPNNEINAFLINPNIIFY